MSIIDTSYDLLVFAASWWKLIALIALAGVGFHMSRRLKLNYFRIDQALGLQSDSFDLQGNIDSEDARSGLDFWSKVRIRWIMFRHRVSFDDARTMDVQNSFALNDVNPDGTPRDPRALFFV